MNQSPIEWATLASDSLCGTDGVLRYITQRRVFAGRFDAGGEPIFEQQWIRLCEPVARPYAGQQFEGLWMPDTPRRFVVLETNHLRLAFDCPAIEQHPRAKDDSLWLSIQAVEGQYRNQAPGAVWKVCSIQRVDPSVAGGPLAGPASIPAMAFPDAGSLRVPLAQAIAYVAEEKSWLAKQRHGLLPWPEMNLSPATAREAACLEVLGVEYFRMRTEQMLFEDILRCIDSGRPNPQRTVVSPMSRAEVVDTLGKRAPLFAQMVALSRHPKLQPAIQHQTEWILSKGRALQSRLARLVQLHAKLLVQATKARQAVESHITIPTASASRPRLRF